MRVQYKGGVWKNAEDEILKAAVMKYGMNQWARIASLMVRKSAKQCKARWFEWLDPSIKKTPWTREEEERLLHLAKIMPTQWRTIAPMIGRTATQCLEHYERLLDDAQRGEAGDGASGVAGASAAASAARARDAHLAAESKPARPDAVDMDEEELEMLGEARARLANTKGKKAKRKAREKQLEAAKRVAHLQKRRELKAAGISLKPRRRDRKQPDLAVEIPHERLVPAGFYDVREENERAAASGTDVRTVGRKLQEFENKSREHVEARARRSDEQRRKFHLQRPEAENAEREDEEQIDDTPAFRAPLVLPKPQVSEAELEAIAKAGRLFANKKSAVQTNGITDALLPERNPVLATPSSVQGGSGTPRTTSGETWADERQRHLETILNLHKTATPLLGGENSVISTPVTVDPSATPRHTPNPLSTPLSEFSVAAADRSSIRKARKLRAAQLKKTVQAKLDALAEPDAEFEYAFDESALAELDEDENMDEDDMETMEDVEDKEKRLAKEGKTALKRARRAALSSAARKQLPIPEESWVNSQQFASGDAKQLVVRDITVRKALKSAPDGTSDADTAAMVLRAAGVLEDREGLRHARALIRAEAEAQAKAGGFSETDILVALEKRDANEMKEFHREQEAKKIADAQAYADGARKAEARMKKRLATLTGGFQNRLDKALEGCHEEWRKIGELETQMACLEELENAEKDTMRKRVEELETRIEQQRDIHARLQHEYSINVRHV